MIKDVDFDKYISYLRQLRLEEFTGKVTVNFFKGNITNLNNLTEPPIWTERSVKIPK